MKVVVPFVVAFLFSLTSVFGSKSSERPHQNTPSKAKGFWSSLLSVFRGSKDTSGRAALNKKILAVRILNSFELVSVPKDDDVRSSASITISHHDEVKKLLDLFDIVKKEEAETFNKFNLRFLEKAVSNYELLTRELQKYRNDLTSYNGSVLYRDVMEFTNNQIDKKSLTLLMACLSEVKKFYENLKNRPENNIIDKVVYEFSICLNRRDVIDAFIELTKDTKIDISKYLDRCDYYNEDFKKVIQEALKDNPKSYPFFHALYCFAYESKKYFNGKCTQADQLLNFEQEMKPKPLEKPSLFKNTTTKSEPTKKDDSTQETAFKPVSTRSEFQFKDVSAKEEMIPRGVKKMTDTTIKPPCKWENFLVIEKIEFVRQTHVFKGIWLGSRKYVVIKLFENKSEFIKEVYYSDLLKHVPFINQLLFWGRCKIRDLRKIDKELRLQFISSDLVTVMEFPMERTLESIIFPKSGKELPSHGRDPLVRKWMAQMIVAVQHMHAEGILHRHLSLDNIFVIDNNDIRICDFGSAKRFKKSHRRTFSRVVGKLAFFPPEVLLGVHEDYSTDVFALGIILYCFTSTDANISKFFKTVIDIISINEGNIWAMHEGLSAVYSNLTVGVDADAPAGANKLIQGMVHLDPTKRLKITEIMQSEYFRGVSWKSLGALENPLSKRDLDSSFAKNRASIIRLFHVRLNHGSEDEIYTAMRRKFAWPTLRSEISDVVAECVFCKRQLPAPPPQFLPVTTLFQRWSIDVISPGIKTSNGNQVILLAIEHFSHWVVARAVPVISPESAISFLKEEVINHYGPPKELFLSQNFFEISPTEEFVHFLSLHDIEHTRIKDQGTDKITMSDRNLFKNNLIRSIMSKGKDSLHWDDYINDILFEFRMNPHPTTILSPFQVLYNIAPRLRIPRSEN